MGSCLVSCKFIFNDFACFLLFLSLWCPGPEPSDGKARFLFCSPEQFFFCSNGHSSRKGRRRGKNYQKQLRGFSKADKPSLCFETGLWDIRLLHCQKEREKEVLPFLMILCQKNGIQILGKTALSCRGTYTAKGAGEAFTMLWANALREGGQRAVIPCWLELGVKTVSLFYLNLVTTWGNKLKEVKDLCKATSGRTGIWLQNLKLGTAKYLMIAMVRR